MNESEKNLQPRTTEKQELLIQQLKKTPIVQIACEKVGVGRASYYRWHKENAEFAKLADEALEEGSSLINDMAESQLLAAIRDQNMTAIIFWLKYHHPAYATKVEVTAKLKRDDTLTPEQESLVAKALTFAQVITNPQEDSGRSSHD